MIPRSEHPEPQFMRSDWLCLNGEWNFEIDKSVSGRERRLFDAELSGKILVPFCPESRLSGIAQTDFLNSVWYSRTFVVPEEQRRKRVILHFGAVDHEAYVYVNSQLAGTHRGGYASFSFDITDLLTNGENRLCVCAIDHDRDPLVGHGKQSRELRSHRCYYTRVTGIWQTVWLEFVPLVHIESIRIYPDILNSKVTLEAMLCGSGTLCAEAFYNGRTMGKTSGISAHGGMLTLELHLNELYLWELGNGRLYQLELSFGEDHVSSYFGMRSLALNGERFLLNGKPVFQRLVLDQGYYPDGIYTAPEDPALENDILLSMKFGFNGARLHQKVFEARFLYHCDRLGYMVWGEYGNWGMDYSDANCIPPILKEWAEILRRDFNHPSIVCWSPLNETWVYEGRKQNDELHRLLYLFTRSMDPTRPCIDTSGAYHVVTDIFDLHDYIQDPETFASLYSCPTIADTVAAFTAYHKKSSLHQGEYRNGQPLMVSEYGGIRWDVENSGGWGYGEGPRTEKEFLDRYRALTEILLENPHISGFCYTQLYDVEQEVNGLCTYARVPKFDPEIIRAINSQKAKIETL